MNKLYKIALDILPVIIMIGLIPLVKNDFILTAIYILIIAAALALNREKKDFIVLVVGFIAMTISEYFFILTGVETFTRISFLGVMPLWLPFLWAYGFVAIKRISFLL